MGDSSRASWFNQGTKSTVSVSRLSRLSPCKQTCASQWRLMPLWASPALYIVLCRAPLTGSLLDSSTVENRKRAQFFQTKAFQTFWHSQRLTRPKSPPNMYVLHKIRHWGGEGKQEANSIYGKCSPYVGGAVESALRAFKSLPLGPVGSDWFVFPLRFLSADKNK